MMDTSEEAFEAYRPYLFAIAYHMMGSAMDAEDMVQETYLRYLHTSQEEIGSLKAFLTTIISHLCVDRLHLAHQNCEQYIGPWLPEPINTEALEVINPEERMEKAETVSLAFLMVLEQLQPVERAVFLLREVFDYDYAEVASFLGKSEVACRQAFSRAKKHLADHRPRFHTPPDTQRKMFMSFQRALQAGEMSCLMHLLAEDVTFWADGVGKVKGVALHELSGREAVVNLLRSRVSLFRETLPTNISSELAEVNGDPALITRVGLQAVAVLSIDVEDDRITVIRFLANPEKLVHLSL